jgi:hypothetical protein
MASCSGYMSLHRPTRQDLVELVMPGTDPMSVAQVERALGSCTVDGFKPQPHAPAHPSTQQHFVPTPSPK